MKILMPNVGRKEREFTLEQNTLLIEFLNRGDITYPNPGMKDVVDVRKIGGVSQYETKRYGP